MTKSKPIWGAPELDTHFMKCPTVLIENAWELGLSPQHIAFVLGVKTFAFQKPVAQVSWALLSLRLGVSKETVRRWGNQLKHMRPPEPLADSMVKSGCDAETYLDVIPRFTEPPPQLIDKQLHQVSDANEFDFSGLEQAMVFIRKRDKK